MCKWIWVWTTNHLSPLSFLQEYLLVSPLWYCQFSRLFLWNLQPSWSSFHSNNHRPPRIVLSCCQFASNYRLIPPPTSHCHRLFPTLSSQPKPPLDLCQAFSLHLLPQRIITRLSSIRATEPILRAHYNLRRLFTFREYSPLSASDCTRGGNRLSIC